MNHKNFAGTSLLTLLTGCALLAFSSQGLAKDVKTYPGTECKPLGTQDSANFSYTTIDGIKNISLITRSVICPLVKDSDKPFSPLNTATLLVSGINSNPTNVSCTANAGSTAVTKNAQVDDDGWFITFTAPFNQNFVGESVNLTCSLPKGASLHLFSFTEMNTGS